ncbi:MAG: dihydroorotase [Rhodospirillaceae bacterium]|nr:dihydroorotase [Rhodospirillaceae bacterium]MCY4239904.1 dihydroorotase [Rhodospirillaceae bacterium]
MNDQHFNLVILGGSVITPSGREKTDVGIRNGRIAEIGNLSRTAAAERFDAAGLHVLPGVIDTQVHFREPGLEHKEDLESGTRGAVKGGVTAIFEMPNTSPNTDSAEALADKVSRAVGRTWCDFAFFVGATNENAETLRDLERRPGCSGVKVFMGSSTGSLLVADDGKLRDVLANGSRRVAIHAEDEDRLRERRVLLDRNAGPVQHPHLRDEESAVRATRRILALARETSRRIHVLHVSTAEELPLLAANKDIATLEATPQHLTLSAPECYERLDAFGQMNPPIRDDRHRQALWQAIEAGIVDLVGSDHAPHTREEKERPYPESPSGVPGVQTLVPVLLDHVNAGRLSLERFVDLTSAGPNRIFGIANKGRIAVGYDADFTIVDLKAQRTITNAWIESKSKWTPFDGMAVTGWPVATIIRGKTVMREDALLSDPTGRPVRFQECLIEG